MPYIGVENQNYSIFKFNPRFVVLSGRSDMSPTPSSVDHSSESSTRPSSGSNRSISPIMTEVTSESLGNDDVFRRSQLSAPFASQTIGARLRDLYDENITAKVIRAGTTCLENNVSILGLSHLDCEC